MERPPHNDERQDESGQIIRFPTRWVPLDGIQPLDEGLLGADRSTGLATCEPDPADDRAPVFEADDFWDGGDTQEFVAAARGPSVESSVSGRTAGVVAAGISDKRREVRLRVRGGQRRTALISLAALALTVIVLGAVALEGHTLGGSHPVASSSTSEHVAHQQLAATKQSGSKHTTGRLVSRSETNARYGRTGTSRHKAVSRIDRHNGPVTVAATRTTHSSRLATRYEATPSPTYSDYHSTVAASGGSSARIVDSSPSGSAASESSHAAEHAPAWGASGALGPMSSPDG